MKVGTVSFIKGTQALPMKKAISHLLHTHTHTLWFMAIIPAFGRFRQEDLRLAWVQNKQTILGYIERPSSVLPGSGDLCL